VTPEEKTAKWRLYKQTYRAKHRPPNKKATYVIAPRVTMVLCDPEDYSNPAADVRQPA
jgi:hypothetical protein